VGKNDGEKNKTKQHGKEEIKRKGKKGGKINKEGEREKKNI
jgi:hypothetical protein